MTLKVYAYDRQFAAIGIIDLVTAYEARVVGRGLLGAEVAVIEERAGQ